ncbi:hypothetical protein [Streptomyces sp. NPDC006610]|uniref:hypothetical protein n=1 Tax=Streptomyces sp. NPDC006610 TaxID=3154584 RepID=UPI0033B77F69
MAAPVAKQGGRLWEGTASADALVPRSMPRPRLRGLLDWTADETAYRAELTEYVPVPPVTSGTPVLARDVALPDAWWADLRAALETLATVPTDREAVRQRWIDNNFRRFLGIDPIQIHAYTTGHGDLHWANLTRAPLILLDWENWGACPSATTRAPARLLPGRARDRGADPPRVRPRRHRRRPSDQPLESGLQ